MIHFVAHKLREPFALSTAVQSIVAEFQSNGISCVVEEHSSLVEHEVGFDIYFSSSEHRYCLSVLKQTYGEPFVLCTLSGPSQKWTSAVDQFGLLVEIEEANGTLPDAQEENLYRAKILCKQLVGKHVGRQFTWLEDEQAERMSANLYVAIHRTENAFRSFITQVMHRAYGGNWWHSVVPQRLREDDRTKGYQDTMLDFRNVDAGLMNIDIRQLAQLCTIRQVKLDLDSRAVKKLLEHTFLDLHELSNELSALANNPQIVATVNSFWDSYFKQYLEEPSFLKRWEKLSDLRNHVAHNKLLSWDFYQTSLGEAHALRSLLRQAMRLLASSSPSQEEIEEQEKYRELMTEVEEHSVWDETYRACGVVSYSGIIDRFNAAFDEQVVRPLEERCAASGRACVTDRCDLSSDEGVALVVTSQTQRLEAQYEFQVSGEPEETSLLVLTFVVNGAVTQKVEVEFINAGITQNDGGYYDPVGESSDIVFPEDEVLNAICAAVGI